MRKSRSGKLGPLVNGFSVKSSNVKVLHYNAHDRCAGCRDVMSSHKGVLIRVLAISASDTTVLCYHDSMTKSNSTTHVCLIIGLGDVAVGAESI